MSTPSTKCPKCGAIPLQETPAGIDFACGSTKFHAKFIARNTGYPEFDQSNECKVRERDASLEKAKEALIGLAMSRHTETGMYCFCDEWRGIGNAKKHSVECDRASAVLKEISDEKA